MDITTIPFSREYNKVLTLAYSYAAKGEKHILLVEHLLAALIAVSPDALSHLLGLTSLLIPDRLRMRRGREVISITLSSEANRILSLYGGEMEAALKDLGELPTELSPIHLALALIRHPRGPVLEFITLNSVDIDPSMFQTEVTRRALAEVEIERSRKLEAERPKRMKSLRKLRARLLKVCHGQDSAIDALISQVATSKGQSVNDRGLKPISFFFLGGSGTGKSLVADTFRRDFAENFGTGLPEVLDMSRFSVESLIIDLAGRDPCWKDGGKPGELTRLAAAHPNGVIILENIDKAHPGALAPIAKILTDGFLLDEFTKEEVSFAGNILIFTSNIGTSYVESGVFARLCARAGGTIPRDKLLEGIGSALRSELPAKAGILEELLAKATRPILFHRHSADSLAAIAEDHVRNTLNLLAKNYGARVSADPRELAAFFIETMQKLDSAHGLAENIENVLTTQLERRIMLADEDISYPLNEITVVVDPLPVLAHESSTLAERTRERLLEAKRLDFSVEIKLAAKEITIHLTDLRHTRLPAIEDAGWFAVEPPNMTAEDLVGLDIAWTEARRILDRLDSGNHGGAKSGHMLLYGPPGTGKTAFAKAIANTLGKSIISVNASNFTACDNPSHAVGLLNDLFAAAERTSSVIFIDECDAFGSRERASSEQSTVINTLLTLLDGFEDHGVLVIGATNLPEKLDPALTRPGRLHTRIKIDVLRKSADRAKLIDIFTRKSGISFDESLKSFIVKATYEWAPANILSVLRRTADLADGRAPTRDHFVKARIIDFAGEETQYQPLSDEDRRQVAIHEVGHALIATLHHHQWIQVSVNGFNHTAGFLETLHNFSTGHTREKILETIDIALAGNAAERLTGTITEGSDSDFRKATKLARRALSSTFDDGGELATELTEGADASDLERRRNKINELLKIELDRTLKMLSAHKDLLLKLADELARRGTMFADDFTRYLGKEVAR